MHLAGNIYSWHVYYAREGREFGADLERDVKEVAAAGLDGLEPILDSPEAADRFGVALRQAGLEMRSAYVNTTLHEPSAAAESLRQMEAIAIRARRHGCRILVTNPNPIQWGAQLSKSDEQLQCQAKALTDLGRILRRHGITLAYHNHDVELLHAARELHHMMLATDPRYVKLCLDAHWIYRGSGNSSVALFDFVKLYGKRVVELHVRQSRGGVWSEVFGEGDIDYRRLVRELRDVNVQPHVVLEQAVETGTPRTMEAREAIRRSAEAVRALFSFEP